MPKLIYSTIASLDGYNADEDGNFDFAFPSDEVLQHINDEEARTQARGTPTYLYGRRMYELMIGWETDPALAAQSAEAGQFATLWQQARKVVYSTTLEATSTRNTELVRSFVPQEVESLKESAEGDLFIDGPTLAAHALRAGLVDEIVLYLTPAIIGGGNPIYPDDVRLDLNLAGERRFDNGMVLLRYTVRRTAAAR